MEGGNSLEAFGGKGEEFGELIEGESGFSTAALDFHELAAASLDDVGVRLSALISGIGQLEKSGVVGNALSPGRAHSVGPRLPGIFLESPTPLALNTPSSPDVYEPIPSIHSSLGHPWHWQYRE